MEICLMEENPQKCEQQQEDITQESQSGDAQQISPISETEGSMTIKRKSVEEVQEMISKCKEEYLAHHLDKAYRLMEECLKTKETAEEGNIRAIEAILDQEHKLFESITSEYAYMQKILNELEDTEGYTVDSSHAGATLCYKYIPNTPMVTLKLEAEVDVPLQVMLTVVYEINLWNHWVPFTERTAEVKKIHRAAAVYYLELGLPYPLHNRESHIYGIGVDRLHENGTILILAESVDENKEFLERHTVQKIENSGTVNMDITFGGFEITPIGRDRCKLRGVANFDPKFTWFPAKMLNYVFKKGIQFALDRLINRARKFKGSVWEKESSREEKQEFYQWLNKLIEDYHQSQNH